MFATFSLQLDTSFISIINLEGCRFYIFPIHPHSRGEESRLQYISAHKCKHRLRFLLRSGSQSKHCFFPGKYLIYTIRLFLLLVCLYSSFLHIYFACCMCWQGGRTLFIKTHLHYHSLKSSIFTLLYSIAT